MHYFSAVDYFCLKHLIFVLLCLYVCVISLSLLTLSHNQQFLSYNAHTTLVFSHKLPFYVAHSLFAIYIFIYFLNYLASLRDTVTLVFRYVILSFLYPELFISSFFFLSISCAEVSFLVISCLISRTLKVQGRRQLSSN